MDATSKDKHLYDVLIISLNSKLPLGYTAVYQDILSGHVGACIAGEKDACSSDVVWFSDPAIHDLIFPAL